MFCQHFLKFKSEQDTCKADRQKVSNRFCHINSRSLICCINVGHDINQWKQQDEDVLTYALFPQVAKEFFESRPAKKPPVEKREILKAAAPEVKKAPVSTEEMDGNGINTWAGRKSESYQI